MIREYFVANAKVPVRYGAPRSNPLVRDRVNLTNAMLRSAAGEIGLLVDRKCKELIKDFEQVSYKEDSNQIDKERDRMRSHFPMRWVTCSGRKASRFPSSDHARGG